MNDQENIGKELKQIKEKKYDELIEQLKDKDKERRLYIINELVELGDERAAEL